MQVWRRSFDIPPPVLEKAWTDVGCAKARDQTSHLGGRGTGDSKVARQTWFGRFGGRNAARVLFLFRFRGPNVHAAGLEWTFRHIGLLTPEIAISTFWETQ